LRLTRKCLPWAARKIFVLNMTEKECLDNILNFCNNELKKMGWWIFNDHTITLEKTRLLEAYEKDANLPLPSVLYFNDGCIDHSGVTLNNVLYKWINMCCTVVKDDRRPTKGDETGKFITDKYLVFSLHSGEILQIKMENTDQYRNLLIHFIEQYKLGMGK
jgi:hypothetical protein